MKQTKKLNKKKRNINFFKKLFVFITFGLAIQFSILYYINNFLLVKRDVSKDMVLKKVVNTASTNTTDIQISLPDDIENLQVSYDSNYISYIDNDNLKVIDTNTGAKKTLDIPKSGYISCYRWIPNRNKLYIAIKEKLKKSSKFTFFSYNADNNHMDEVKYDNEATKIVSNTKSEIEDINSSPLTGIVCLKLKNSTSRNSLYKIDRMNHISKLDVNNTNISDISLLLNNDAVVYETLPNHKIYILNRKNTSRVNIENSKKLKLINTDKNDIIYLGELVDDKISTIYYKKLDDDNTDWAKLKLPYEVNKKDLYLIDRDKIYVNDSLKNTLTEITTNKQTTYKGKLLGIYDSKIVCNVDSKLLKINIK
ncbi:hypothetical protein RBU49_10390 [Clostridium sp. MB40-C1]|uniref:hypothetical protein n=1 Tax=Clostridium sp. MB40-C1 TaxID=3070996 RepID=UPI0027E00239|nr:hypothetical protein [Clostridium sp. MB40-C1]WMJ79298.1 hypothetical protein RBU49_10390 [Clostridium sp. MB40-C1]